MSTDLSFEEAFKALEQVVQDLERGATTLDEALGLYARGVELANHCEQLLATAQLQVRQLQQNGDGDFVETPFSLE